MKITIISGRSGSGKSVCLHVLEDLGYYCIDNLPASLLPSLVKLVDHQPRIAVSIDARNLPADLDRFTNIIDELNKSVTAYEIIYLDAKEDTLLKRFSETRRKHPLSSERISLQEALQRESQLLEPIAHIADIRIDTTNQTVQSLREFIRNRIPHKTNTGLSILIESFGYKFGVPADADYTFDVRCLPNPYWDPNLRSLTGKNKLVAQFLEKQPLTKKLIKDIIKFLETWLPHFEADNRNYMTIAIGCTGGQHRSVYVSEKIAAHFAKKRSNVQIRHREI